MKSITESQTSYNNPLTTIDSVSLTLSVYSHGTIRLRRTYAFVTFLFRLNVAVFRLITYGPRPQTIYPLSDVPSSSFKSPTTFTK